MNDKLNKNNDNIIYYSRGHDKEYENLINDIEITTLIQLMHLLKKYSKRYTKKEIANEMIKVITKYEKELT